MKKTLAAVVLLFSALAWARSAPNPTDYNLNVHISSSRVTDRGSLRLTVTIDGKKVELSGFGPALLVLGDYKAKLMRDDHKNTYDSFRIYEFLFPDGKTRKYYLVGITE
jgi:hypothetical protein